MKHNPTSQRVGRGAITALVALILLVLAAPQLWYPLGFDQAVYAACGDVIRRGGVPIRDCFETKQMGVMVMYAIPMALSAALQGAPSAAFMAIHGFTLLWTAATAVVIARLGWALFGRNTRAGVFAGVAYWLIYAGINYWSMDQAETFANLFLVLAVHQLWHAATHLSQPTGTPTADLRRSLIHAFVAGLCIGVAVWFKYIFGLIGVVLGVCMLLWIGLRAKDVRGTIRRSIGVGAAYAAGVLAVIVLGLGYYALQAGGLDALAQQWRFLQDNFPLTPPLPPDGMARMVLRFLDNGADLTADFKATVPQWIVLGGGFPLLFVLAGIGFVRGLKASRAVVLTLVTYFISAVALVIWQGNYIQYHFTIVLPPLVLLAGAALLPRESAHASTYAPTSRLIRIGTWTLALVTIGLLALRMGTWVADAYRNVLVQHKTVEQIYRESRQAAHLDGADYLRQHTQPSETIAVFGDAPWLYTLSERPNATRFPFINIWIKTHGTAQYNLMIGQFLEGVARNRPIYVVVPSDNFPWPNNSTTEDFKQATQLYDYVQANYAYEAEIGPFLMFRRKVR